MILVSVASLALDSRSQPVVVLRPVDTARYENKMLPIWIGPQEATAIMLAVEGGEAARPMSYDLMARLLATLGAQVRQVAVTRLEQGTFFAEISLDTPDGAQVVDARPSDSIALAVRVGAPIYVAEAVLAEAGMNYEEQPDEQESQLAAFSEFLDQVDPEDFSG